MTSGMDRVELDGAFLYRWRVFAPWSTEVAFGVTCRPGGASDAPFTGLNLGQAVGDDPGSVFENRQMAARLLGAAEDASWAFGDQVHGTRIMEVSPSFDPGDAPFPATDGVILTEPGVIAAVLLADCLPVAVYDPVRKTGALCHAGWRGTLAGIAATAVDRLVAGGSTREDLVAAAGPGIGLCCFEVGGDVAEQFLGEGRLAAAVEQDSEGIFRIDLEEANLIVLKEAGLREDRIGRGGFCTACRPSEFYSYRKENGVTGRHAALMTLFE